MDDLRLALRAFRWRRGGSLVVLLAGALTVAAAALGPLFASAAAESVLQDRLTQAEADQTTIAFRVDADVSYPGSVTTISDAQAVRGTIPGYGPQVNETVVLSGAQEPGGLPSKSQAVWRDGVCDHVEIVDGVCDTSTGVLVSQRSAQTMDWQVGDTLVLDGLQQYDTSVAGSDIATKPTVTTIAGIYRPFSQLDSYWAGRIYFPFHPNADPEGPPTVDSVFVDESVFPLLKHPTMGTIGADLVLTDPQALRVADVPKLRADVESYLGPETRGPAPTTGVLELLDRFEAERTALGLAAGVVSAQLALLAWLLLYLVVTDTSEARGSEVALAKLRGLPPRAVAAVALREPVVLLLLAVPVGLVLSWLLVQVLARALLAPGSQVALTPGVWLAVGLAFLGGLVAAGLASRRMFTRPVLEQWSTASAPERSGRGGLILDVVLAAIAVGGFVLLSRGTTDDLGTAGSALAWLAPGLLVLAAGLLLVRLARPVLKGLVRSTRATSRIGLFLGSRQAVRRPAGLRLAGLLAVTLGLATFAVDAQAAATASRDVRAGADVGATVSLAVQRDPSRDLPSVIDEVDPDGRWAMAVASWIPSGGLAGRLVGVEPDRLAQVAAWASQYGDLSASDVASLLSPPLPDPIALRTDAVRLTLDSGPVAGEAPLVVVAYRNAVDVPTFSIAGPLREGTHEYVAEVPCTEQDCVFYGMVLKRPQAAQAQDFDVALSSVEQRSGGAWTPVEAGLATQGDYRLGAYTGQPAGQVAVDGDALRLTGSIPPFTSPWIQYADVPLPLPLVTASAIATTGTDLAFKDINAREITATSVGDETVLPFVGSFGSLTDLTSLRRVAAELDDQADWMVWLGPDAPDDAVQRLEDAGIAVDRVTTLAQRSDQLSREGPALALKLLLVCAIIGALLAAGALAISVAVTGRRRSYELAALGAVGVGRRSLLRACVLEQALLLGTGLVVGVPVGLVVARLALPLLPQTSTATTVPISLDIQGAAVLAFTVLAGLLLLITAVIAGAALLRQAVPDRLREAAT
ncbi:MAG: hypothetical protein LCI03_01405 [Actinobacteria bacterium]|nr:hypothetical protein [Actinomycetota bacterium]